MTDHKPSTMIADALKACLNYIENTENELGIRLSCGDAARAVLATECDTLDGLLSEAKASLAAAQAEIARLREALVVAAVGFEATAIEHDMEDRKGSAGNARRRAQECRAALVETAATPAPAPAPADDGWTAWEGGECPVPMGIQVEIRLLNGQSFKCNRSETWWWGKGAGVATIVAYRIVDGRDG